jgi:hypothetical protein
MIIINDDHDIILGTLFFLEYMSNSFFLHLNPTLINIIAHHLSIFEILKHDLLYRNQ